MDNTENTIDTDLGALVIINGTKGTHKEYNHFYVANIGKQDVILGSDWLVEHNPEFHWRNYSMDLNRCPKTCQIQGKVTIRAEEVPPRSATKTRRTKTRNKQDQIPPVETDEEETEPKFAFCPRKGSDLIYRKEDIPMSDPEVEIRIRSMASNHSQRLAQQ